MLRIPSLPPGVLLLTLVFAVAPAAVAEDSFRFDIRAQALNLALVAFTRQSRIQVLYEGDIAKDARSAAVSGQLSPEHALALLLRGTGLRAATSGHRTFTLKRDAMAMAAGAGPVMLEPVRVTASYPYGDGSQSGSYARIRANSATRTDTPILEMPLSVQVVSRAVMDDQSGIQIGDAIKNVSSVSQGFTFGGFAETFIIRGFDTSYANYRDGFRFPASRLPLADAEQVEVVKGAASNLFGRVQPGGIINVVTKQPQFSPYHALEQRIGSFDLARLRADLTGPLAEDGALRYRVNLEHLHRNSFRDYAFTHRVFVSPSLAWDMTERTRLKMNLLHSDETTQEDYGLVAVGNRPARLPLSRYLQEPTTDISRTELLQISLYGDHRLTDTWNLRGSFVRSGRRVFDPQTGGRALDAKSGELQRDYYGGAGSDEILSGTLEIEGGFDAWGTHRLLGGWSIYRQQGAAAALFLRAHSINIYRPIYLPISLGTLESGNNWFLDHLDGWQGVYLQDQARLTDKIHVMVGGRYDWTLHKSGNVSGFDKSLADARAVSETTRAGRFSPRLGLVYQPLSWLSFFGNYVESLGSVNTGISPSGKPLPPESGEQFEAGAKTQSREGGLNASMAFYHLTKHNIARPLNNSVFSQSTDEARSRGIEVDLSGRLVEGLDLAVSYAFTDARVTKGANLRHRLPIVPEHAGSVWLKYAVPIRALDGLDLGGGVYLQGPRAGDLENSFQLPGYVRLDTMLKYQLPAYPNLTVQFNIENLLDRGYFLTASGRYGVVPGTPRAFFGSIRLEY